MPALPSRMMRNSLIGLWLVAAFAVCASTGAQEGSFRDSPGGRSKGRSAKPQAQFEIDLVPSTRSGEAILRIKATIPAEHYISSTNDNGGAETRFEFETLNGLEAIDEPPVADHPPKEVDDIVLQRTVEKYYDHVTWSLRFRLNRDTEPGDVKLSGLIRYQICNARTCTPSKFPFEVKLAAGAVAPAEAREEKEEEADEPAPPKEIPVFNNLGLGGIGNRAPKPVPEFQTRLQPGASTDEVVLEIRVAIPPDYYIYSTGEQGTAKTVIKLSRIAGLEPIDEDFVANPPPKIVEEEDSNEKLQKAEKHFSAVTWTKRFRKVADVSTPAVVEGMIAYQICGGGVCRTLDQAFSTDPDAKPAVAPSNEGDRGEAVVPASGEKGHDANVAVRGIDKSQGLLWFMLRAVGFGFAALLTPCSFPMVPITVSFFHKQAEKEHHRPISMALIYCAGIVGTFTFLGLVLSAVFGGAVLNELANNPWLNLFLALLLVFFALNLLGMFEIRVPSSLLTYTATQEGRGGMIGVLFMALTFTLTSFTCTFAFVGTVLVDAANGGRIWPTAGLFAFSAAFSLPFFFLALFPSFLQKLPRSGGWMNVVKVVMGLVELGAAFKFFSVADLRWHPAAWVFDYELVMSAWMIISISAALYLLGLFRLPHDMPTEHIGVARFMSAMSFLGLAAYLAVGLYSAEKPTGKVWENIAAFAPPKFKGGSGQFGPTLEHGGIKYALDFQRAVEYAAKENKPIFIDFTGVNCVNCRKMEQGPLSQRAVTERLKDFVCVQVYADKVPHIADASEADRLLTFNVKLQTKWFGDTSLPSYVVIPPDPEIASRKEGESILAETIGYDPDETKFVEFLDQGLNRWRKLQAERPRARALGQR